MHKEAKETFAYLTFPKVKPEKVIGDFLESKLNERILKKYPEWDLPRIDPKVNLVSAKRDLHYAETRLANKKNEACGRRKYLVEEWNNLEKEQEKFRQTFCQFDRMIEENGRKIQRTLHKKKGHVLSRTKAENDISNLEVEYAYLLEVREKLETQVKDHGVYECYLQSVVEAAPGEFRNVQDVFNKFASLYEVRSTLAKQTNKNIVTIEEARDKLERLSMEHNVVLNGLNNQITVLHVRYRAAKEQTHKWEKTVHFIQKQLCEKYADSLSVKSACQNMYDYICKYKQITPTPASHNFKAQLVYIKSFFQSLKNTIAHAQNVIRTDAFSIIVERPSSPKK